MANKGVKQLKWSKINDSTFKLSRNDSEIGLMTYNFHSFDGLAKINIENLELIIQRTGFWRNTLEILDKNRKLVLEQTPVKWHADTYTIFYKNTIYYCELRNTPLAELIIYENEEHEPLIVYSLNPEGNRSLRIKENENLDEEDFNLLHFLAWYQFQPITQETEMIVELN